MYKKDSALPSLIRKCHLVLKMKKKLTQFRIYLCKLLMEIIKLYSPLRKRFD